MFIYDPICYSLHAANVDRARFSRIKVVDPVALANPNVLETRNTDGVHLNGPWDHVTIEDIQGTSSDDFIALNSADGNLVAGAGGPASFGSFANVYYGNGGTTIIRNLRPYNAASILRLLTGSDTRDSGVNPSVIDYVSVDDVAGTSLYGPVQGHPGTAFGIGTGGNVNVAVLRNWRVGGVPGFTPGDFPTYIGINIPDEHVVHGLRLPLRRPQELLVQRVQLGGNVGILNVIDYEIVEDASELSSPAPAILINGSTVGTLSVRGLKWGRNAATAQTAIAIQAAVGLLKVADSVLANVDNLIAVSGSGTVTGLSLAVPSHIQGCNASPTVSVGSGTTVAPTSLRRPACSNYVSQLVAGAGTVEKAPKTELAEDS